MPQIVKDVKLLPFERTIVLRPKELFEAIEDYIRKHNMFPDGASINGFSYDQRRGIRVMVTWPDEQP